AELVVHAEKEGVGGGMDAEVRFAEVGVEAESGNDIVAIIGITVFGLEGPGSGEHRFHANADHVAVAILFEVDPAIAVKLEALPGIAGEDVAKGRRVEKIANPTADIEAVLVGQFDAAATEIELRADVAKAEIGEAANQEAR